MGQLNGNVDLWYEYMMGLKTGDSLAPSSFLLDPHFFATNTINNNAYIDCN